MMPHISDKPSQGVSSQSMSEPPPLPITPHPFKEGHFLVPEGAKTPEQLALAEKQGLPPGSIPHPFKPGHWLVPVSRTKD